MNNEILATLDMVSSDGTAEGWAMYCESIKPCYVQLRLDNAVLAEDIADKFRRDLLFAGVGLGHCAFYAHMKPLPPGTYPLQLFDGHTGKPMGSGEPRLIEIRSTHPPSRMTLEALLRPRDRWRDEDVLAAPASLQLDRNYGLLGPERYVDRIFRFVLGRWADPSGLKDYAGFLREGKMTPIDVFVAVMGSNERRGQNRPLPRPTDPDYPFIYENQMKQVAPADPAAASDIPDSFEAQPQDVG